jgi:prophage maintenance system killer protein
LRDNSRRNNLTSQRQRMTESLEKQRGAEESSWQKIQDFLSDTVVAIEDLSPAEAGEVRESAAALAAVGTEVVEVTERLQQEKSSPGEAKFSVDAIRYECQKLEGELGIETASQRMQEALLFIDQPFLEAAAVRGDEHPEELFGVTAWRGWLTARLEARQMKELSVSNVRRLHAKLTAGLEDGLQGIFRTRGGLGGDYSELGEPLTFSKGEVKAIRENPYLTIRWKDKDSLQGWIAYPSIKRKKIMKKLKAKDEHGWHEDEDENLTTEQLLRGLTNGVCEWYNRELHRDSDVTQRAADLQRRIVSIHPFRDGNGRLSRLLLNWALEQEGASPTVVAEGHRDLLMSKNEWRASVEKGQHSWESMNDIAAGSNMAAQALLSKLYPDGRVRAFLEMAMAHGDGSMMPRREDLLNHGAYEAALMAADVNSCRFSQETSAHTWLETENKGYNEREHGGLIPEDFIAAWGDTRPPVQREVRERFYHTENVYRGVKCSDIDSAEDIVKLFERPAPVTSSYRALGFAEAKVTSGQPIDPTFIRATMHDYNEMVWNDYRVENNTEQYYESGQIGAFFKHEERQLQEIIEQPYVNEVRPYLEYLLKSHQDQKTDRKRIHMSPAVSTSLRESTPHHYARRINATTGLVIKSLLPKYGLLYMNAAKDIPILRAAGNESYVREQEIMIMGGIDPNAVEEIEWYRRGRKIGSFVREGLMITQHDVGGNEIAQYRFNDEGELNKITI